MSMPVQARAVHRAHGRLSSGMGSDRWQPMIDPARKPDAPAVAINKCNSADQFTCGTGCCKRADEYCFCKNRRDGNPPKCDCKPRDDLNVSFCYASDGDQFCVNP